MFLWIFLGPPAEVHSGQLHVNRTSCVSHISS